MKIILLFFLLFNITTIPAMAKEFAPIEEFLALLEPKRSHEEQLSKIEQHWDISSVPMLLETMYLNRNQTLNGEIISILNQQTQQPFGYNLDDWYQWLWQQDYKPHPRYPEFKARLYRIIDPKFFNYFKNEYASKIRLDEVRWGGVRQDGIPPLRQPKMIPAKDASYLKDDHIVFGIEVNGDVRAYPKRILAWHEMFVDTVGGESVTGVYCTLCGTVILYRNTLAETEYQLGTSGFLYRSNKLMYDRSTQSLWNTLWGKPVIGSLVGNDIQLEKLSVVTTTWGEWRKRHSQTTVLSLNTGHRRDYGEGVAYQSYFATDELMFIVPETDTRLANKAEVLGLLFPEYPDQPLAIDSAFLQYNPVYHSQLGSLSFVVLTDASGAHRVYAADQQQFQSWDQQTTVIDRDGNVWQLSESKLTGPNNEVLHRLPSHNAFWFGWYSAYKQSRLIQ